ncbi:FG-GAP repeat domain-containing protein [Nonomuraea sp. NPDC049480]|uniref:FG-GAP repeat domain-containing protein n=1 Tax=Nonomuraea sp. NPDC049480 TaxID=3364353 RepID=UPI0037B96FB4
MALSLVPAACGNEPRPATGPRTTPQPPTPTASSAPTTAAPPTSTPRAAKDKRRADDLNGDGRADLIVEVGLPSKNLHYLAAVYGSPRGLDQRKKTIVPPDMFYPWLIGPSSRADLDGDGFGDIVGYGRPNTHEDMRPHIFWGGPRGIDATTLPTRMPLPMESNVAANRAAAGDFDGDGNADVAVSRPPAVGQGDATLMILYGPFSREGVSSRQIVQESPTGDEFWRITVDKIKGRRATGLIVFERDDGEQTSGWLLEAGPGGLSKQGYKLTKGMAAVFGDFDGDGSRDVAVGDDGSRNDEPGYETEAPSVSKTLTVYYGDGRTKTFKGTKGPAVSGDFNGDGRDDLAFGGAHPRYDSTRISWGSSAGLRPGDGVHGLTQAMPLAAGDYDGDGDDELAFASVSPAHAAGEDRFEIFMTDGRRVLTRFKVSPD